MASKTLNLESKVSGLPQKPGVYQFLDSKGGVLYIGKAKNLRARVAQYFGRDERPQIPYLMQDAADIHYTVVSNELESAFLENTLIKQYLPKYNILLRDDKNYAFIKIDYSTQIPQIGYARKIDPPTNYKLKTKNSVYFGPYSAAYKIRETLRLVRKIFSYCSAEKVGSRPCFYYHMHRCPGICLGKMSLPDYYKHLENIAKFLRGDTMTVTKTLTAQMTLAVKQKNLKLRRACATSLNS